MNQNSLAVHLRNRGSRDLSYRNPRHTPLDNRYRLYIPVELLSMWSFWQFYCPSILWILASYIQLLKNLRRSIISTDCNRTSFLYWNIRWHSNSKYILTLCNRKMCCHYGKYDCNIFHSKSKHFYHLYKEKNCYNTNANLRTKH